MGRKKTNPGIYLYPHDILSSPRCRSLTPGGAGIYFFLFLRLCDPPVPGAYRLRDWEPHPKWAKSDTRKCLKIADKRERLPLFAKWLAKNDLPWTKNEVLPYLQELYDRGIVIVEGDMLIQPRLFVDNGFDIPDIDGDGDPVGTILDDPTSGQMRAIDNTLQGGLNLRKNKGTEKGTEKCTEKGTKKGTKKPRVGERDAQAPSKRVGVGDNNINSSSTDSSSNKEQNGNDGGTAAPQISPKNEKDAAKTMQNSTQKVPVRQHPPTLEDIQAYCDERRQQHKPFLYITAEEFLDICVVSDWTRGKKNDPIYDWKAYLRQCDLYRQRHGDGVVAGGQRSQQQGVAVAATSTHEGKYRKRM